MKLRTRIVPLGIILTDSFDDLSRTFQRQRCALVENAHSDVVLLKDSTIGAAQTEACVFTDEGD